MSVEVNDVLHVLAHELRTPVGIAHGYVRLLLEDRLPQEADRRRALEQMQKALARLTDLSHETTALAAWYEHDREMLQRIDASQLLARVADADYESPVEVEGSSVPAGTLLRSPDGEAVTQALIGVVRATARELRGRTCEVVARVVDGRFEMLVGAEGTLDRLKSGPAAPDAGPVALERGGLGLALIHAALVLDVHGAQRWTVGDSRQLFGVRLPLSSENGRPDA
jgi:hypothetical protein